MAHYEPMEHGEMESAPARQCVERPVRQEDAHRVAADSEIRRLLKDDRHSSFQKYRQLTVGDASFLFFCWLELLNLLLGGLRGGLGLFLRQRLYPTLFHRCGKGVVIGSNVTLRHPQRISIGNNVIIDDGVVLDAKGDARGVTLHIADGTVIGRNTSLVCKGGRIELAERVNISVQCTLFSETELYVGRHALIAAHCYLIAGGNHGTEFSGVPFVDQPRLQKGGIFIRANCWIGAHATLLDGITVGPDSIVGAAALVRRSVPRQTVVGGVPARVLETNRASAVMA